MALALIVGLILPIAVGLFATGVGLDRDRAFYPTIMLVIAYLYTLFAAIGGSSHALVLELLAGTGFAALTVFGFRSSLWLVAAALACHGLFDFVHGHVIANPGVPTWWPAFCGSYDVVAAVYMGGLLMRGRIRASA